MSAANGKEISGAKKIYGTRRIEDNKIYFTFRFKDGLEVELQTGVVTPRNGARQAKAELDKKFANLGNHRNLMQD